VHPVIVGKRALPALSLVTDAATLMGVARRSGIDEVFAHQLGVLGAGDDIALGISSDGRCRNVLRGLEAAHAAGLLTVALLGSDGGPIAASAAVDHALVVPSDDPHVTKEVHVTAYHVLWELVHVFFEQPGLLNGGGAASSTPAGGVEALYPFLYDGTTNIDDVLADVARSTAEKATDIVALRRAVAQQESDRVAACAADLAAAFAGGGKLMAFGNGGSSSDAQEVAQSFLDPAHDDVRPLPALCLTNDVAVVTALSNDVDFEVIFARQVRAFGKPGDVVVGLSTSGNSPNVVDAFAAAKEIGMTTACTPETPIGTCMVSSEGAPPTTTTVATRRSACRSRCDRRCPSSSPRKRSSSASRTCAGAARGSSMTASPCRTALVARRRASSSRG
jgi:D-sedoheptulose 7-phosphate isomerase